MTLIQQEDLRAQSATLFTAYIEAIKECKLKIILLRNLHIFKIRYCIVFPQKGLYTI